ncbi:MAG TPA: hypothetical protein VH142_25560 [Polyangiaceae bacterium]|jgi:glutamine synthetase|nr:hypothetical protein [Polyangiaceae bacterium]
MSGQATLVMRDVPRQWAASTPEEFDALSTAHAWKHCHVGLFDVDGVFREKRVPLAVARDYVHHGWSFIDALPYWNAAERCTQDLPFVGENCGLDLASVRPYPFEASSALVVADYAGPSRRLSARVKLSEQVARAASLGFRVSASTELEFIVLDETAETLRKKAFSELITHAQHNRCWSGYMLATDAELLAQYETVLAAGDVPLHHYCAELGPGCLEIALPQRSVMHAADDAALGRLFTKAFFQRRGLTASFMAKLSDDHPGLGGHPILSLFDLTSGAASFFDATRPHGLSEVLRGFVAGVLAVLPEVTALFAHTTNAYRRYAPGNWAPRTATWGIENYTCGLRVVTGRPEDVRIEFRLPGADMNPHATFAALLAAGLDGIEERLEPPLPCAAIGRDAGNDAGRRLPRGLLEAADAFAASAFARRHFGDAFVSHFAETRIREAEEMRRHVSSFERARYLHTV